MAREPGCVFCDIVAGDAPARMVTQDRGVSVFLPDKPATRGHILIVPDDHVGDIWSLTHGAARNLASETLRVAGAVREAVQPDGLNVIQSNGLAASQTVDHLHVHVLPRWTGDVVGDFWPTPNPIWAPTQLDAMQADLVPAVAASSAPGYDLSNEQDREDRRKHLDLISGAIGRMAGSSAAAKGWSVTLAGTAFGVALVRESWPFIAVGILVLAAFGALDYRYLDNERRARQVYNSVADDNSEVPFSMRGLATNSKPGHWWWPSQFRNWSVWLFYAPLALVGGALLAFALLAGSAEVPASESSLPDGQHQGQ